MRQYAQEHPYKLTTAVTLPLLGSCGGPIAVGALSSVGFTAAGVTAGVCIHFCYKTLTFFFEMYAWTTLLTSLLLAFYVPQVRLYRRWMAVHHRPCQFRKCLRDATKYRRHWHDCWHWLCNHHSYHGLGYLESLQRHVLS